MTVVEPYTRSLSHSCTNSPRPSAIQVGIPSILSPDDGLNVAPSLSERRIRVFAPEIQPEQVGGTCRSKYLRNSVLVLSICTSVVGIGIFVVVDLPIGVCLMGGGGVVTLITYCLLHEDCTCKTQA